MTWSPCLSRLIQAADGDLGAAQQGIVYIDEIDKIKAGGAGFKDMRLGVQHALLKMLEGTIATVPPEGGWKHPAAARHPIRHEPTSCSSAAGRSWVWKTSSPSGSGGASGLVRWLRTIRSADGLLRQVKPEDLEAFGLIPELIGRLPVIAPLDALGVDDLARILSFDEGIIDPAVQEAGQVPRCGSWCSRMRRSGRSPGSPWSVAREPGGFESVIEEVLEGVLFDAEAGVRYVITDKTVRGGEAVKQSMRQTRAPLGSHVMRRLVSSRNR